MPKLRLGDALIQEGVIDEMQLNAALAHQRQWGGFLGKALIEQGMVDELRLYDVLSRQLHIPLVSIANRDIPAGVVKTIPRELCTEHSLFPFFFTERTLYVATAVPQQLELQDRLSFQTGFKVEFQLAPLREIEWAVRFFHDGDRSPCPPPKERVAFSEDEDLKLVDRAGNTMVGKSMADIQREHEMAQRGAQRPPAHQPASGQQGPSPGPAPGGPSPEVVQTMQRMLGSLQQEVAGLRQELGQRTAALQQQKDILQAVVSLCVQKGYFTEEEFRALLQSLRR